jgi:hypothetical protein
MVTGALYQWVKLPVREADHWTPAYIQAIPLISYLNPLIHISQVYQRKFSRKFNKQYPVFIYGLTDQYAEADTHIYEMFVPNTLMSAHQIHCDMNPIADSTIMFKGRACQHANHVLRASVTYVIICRIRLHMQCLVRRWHKDARRLSWVWRSASARGDVVRISAALRPFRCWRNEMKNNPLMPASMHSTFFARSADPGVLYGPLVLHTVRDSVRCTDLYNDWLAFGFEL